MQVRPVSIPKTQIMDFVSRVNGRRYSVSVALPSAAAPENGYRVLYLLDGYAYFASATEAVRRNAPGVVVVGIGYPDDPAFVKSVLERHAPLPVAWLAGWPSDKVAFSIERYYDLTLPASDELLAERHMPGMFAPTAKDVGGLDDFLKTIETEVKPRIEALTSIDRSHQAFFGHSFGGLAVIHALFVEPDAFRTFIASSPSIWWNHRAVLADEAKFSAAVSNGTASARVLITVGGEEDIASPALAAKAGVDPAKSAATRQEARMVENARELTARLQALRGASGYEAEDYVVFPKQGHGTSPWPALGRAISFAFQQGESRF
jgi:hypothetical protein